MSKRNAGLRLYLVHASDDHLLASFLKTQCEAIPGIDSVFVASKAGQIPTGTPWLKEIHRNLKKTDKFLFLLTPRSIERMWIWYEAGVAWRAERRNRPNSIPLAAAGLDRGKIPLPLGSLQALALDQPDDATVLFQKLGGQLDPGSAEEFCKTVRDLAARAKATDEAQLQAVKEAFGELGPPARSVLKRMLAAGKLTLDEIGKGLKELSFVSDPASVEKIVGALKERGLVRGDEQGQLRVKSELERAVRDCFQPPKLSTMLLNLAEDIEKWIGDGEGPTDPAAFRERFKGRLIALRDKAKNDYAESEDMFSESYFLSNPANARAVRDVATALRRLAQKVQVHETP
jgi:hypothetical protein